jgi:DNA polymerase-1
MYGDVDISADMRRVAKSVNFGVVYGITGYGLARVLDMSVADCTRYIDAFYAMYPGVRTYYDDILEG